MNEAPQIRLSPNDHARIISLIVPSLFLIRKSRDFYSGHAWRLECPGVSSPMPYDNKVINLIHFYNTISNNLYGFCDSSSPSRFFWYSCGFACFSWLGDVEFVLCGNCGLCLNDKTFFFHRCSDHNFYLRYFVWIFIVVKRKIIVYLSGSILTWLPQKQGNDFWEYI